MPRAGIWAREATPPTQSPARRQRQVWNSHGAACWTRWHVWNARHNSTPTWQHQRGLHDYAARKAEASQRRRQRPLRPGSQSAHSLRTPNQQQCVDAPYVCKLRPSGSSAPRSSPRALNEVNGLQASSDLLEHIAAINFLRREAGLRCSAHQPTSWYSPPPPSKRCPLLQPALGTCNPLSGHHGRRAEALLTFRTSAPAARDAEQQ